MKFRTISRLIYLQKARHHRGHGIHSPFLFYLITKVIENKGNYPEYNYFKSLKNKVFNSLGNFSDPSITKICDEFDLTSPNPKKLYKKIELPIKYGKIVFQLIREFKPSSVISYGPTFGTNLVILAMANNNSHVYHVINDPVYELISMKLLKGPAIVNIHFVAENTIPTIDPEFVMVNCPNNPDISRSVTQKYINKHSDDCVLIIRGIHESKEMETIWREMIVSERVHVSLDLFEIGIILFRKGLQKENYILMV
jgi:hypothetical protein